MFIIKNDKFELWKGERRSMQQAAWFKPVEEQESMFGPMIAL